MTIQKGLSKLLIDFSAAVVQIIFGLLLLSFYHPLFILLGIVLVLLLTLIFWFTGPIGLKSSLEESSFKFKVAHWLEEVSRTVLTFKLSGNSELPLRKTDEFTSGYLDARQSHFRVLLTQYKVMVLFKLVVAAALIIAGSILVVEGKINIGQFVAAEIIIILVINSVEKIILNMSTVYDVLTALEKVGNLMDLSLERQDGNDLVQTGPYAGFKIEMKSLSFRLEDQKNNLLNNIDFSLQPGERLFVSGENGRGKTTLLKLIAGFYEHYEGSILINDIPLSNLKLSSVRSVIGENFTEQEIFRGSVLDNILCGKPGYSIDDAIQAAKLSGIQEHISNLKDGYATLLEPEGKQLSSGIIRKIVLARCLVTKPGILLLEDNLSSLPGKEKSQLINDIFQSCKGMTIVVVSNDETIGALCTKRLAL